MGGWRESARRLCVFFPWLCPRGRHRAKACSVRRISTPPVEQCAGAGSYDHPDGWVAGALARRDPARVRLRAPRRAGSHAMPYHRGRSPRGPRWLLEENFPGDRREHYHFRAIYQAQRRGPAAAEHRGRDPLAGCARAGGPAGSAAGHRLPPRRDGHGRDRVPHDQGTDAQGWTEVSDTYLAPSRASQAIVELHLRWAAAARCAGSACRLTEDRPRRRPGSVRLATVHFKPRAGRRRRTIAACTSP